MVKRLALNGLHTPHLFLLACGLLLTGYAFLDRGFAYLGHRPIYVGEFVLGLGIVTTLISVRHFRMTLIHWLILAFILWGALRAAYDLPRYGVETLRDSVIWGYSLFALILSWTLGAAEFRLIQSWYSRLLPLFLCWAPVAIVLLVHKETVLELATGSGGQGVVKAGDIAAHLGGVAAFAMAGLHATRLRVANLDLRRVELGFLVAIWVVSLFLVGALTRGGLIAVVVAVVSALVFRPIREWLPASGIVGIVLVAMVVFQPSFSLGGVRTVSTSQIEKNIASVFSSSGETKLEGTKSFRIKWWGKIVSYTLFGPYFWTGKGYGLNLADADGFQANQDRSLRSPHDSHMTILARGGVPALVIWLLLQGTFGTSLLLAARRAKRRQAQPSGQTLIDWYSVDAWIFVYWLALLVNSSFDVYLEGPQGGIWFWCLMGAGMAALACQADPRPLAPVKAIGTGNLLSAKSRSVVQTG